MQMGVLYRSIVDKMLTATGSFRRNRHILNEYIDGLTPLTANTDDLHARH